MYLALFWHHHQPLYKLPGTSEYVLPWALYHMKNYHQMAVLTEELEFPSTFNLVPCLIEQILDYTEGRAKDPVWEALKAPTDRLSDVQVGLLKRFAANETDPGRIQRKALKSFLSPLVSGSDDLESLLDRQNQALESFFSLYKALWDRGIVDLTTSAYYHPLLPLVFDISTATDETLPGIPFRRPEDGRHQLRKGKEYFEMVFGRPPSGFWPPEGAVSREVASAVSESGYSFMLTDENVFWKSMSREPSPEALCRPYKSDGVSVFFRNRELSDLLGFVYKSWNENEAVEDFARRLEAKRDSLPEEALVVVALDGENPWGLYRENGVPFQRTFFSRLKTLEGIVPVTLKDYLDEFPPQDEISLAAGTWLGNFSKWVGHPAKNKAWERLGLARQACGPLEELYIAEGSDWFWWYGEEGTPEFDKLFREYIRAAYARTGKAESHE